MVHWYNKKDIPHNNKKHKTQRITTYLKIIKNIALEIYPCKITEKCKIKPENQGLIEYTFGM
jgi:hypothetical protein